MGRGAQLVPMVTQSALKCLRLRWEGFALTELAGFGIYLNMVPADFVAELLEAVR